MNQFSYQSLTVPDDYRCCECGRHGVKLWRISACSYIELKCCDCSANEPGMDGKPQDISKMTAEGSFPGTFGDGTDQFWSRVPAVPDETNQSYWGYTSVPSDGVWWWKNLPNRPIEINT